MILLDPQNYYKLEQPLKSVEINHLFAQAVVERKMDGEIYVDEANLPSTFYVRHPYGQALLFGKTDNHTFNQHLVSYLLNEDNQRKSNEWLQVYPQEWNMKLTELLAGRLLDHSEEVLNQPTEKRLYLTKYTRVNFCFNRAKYESVVSNGNSELKLIKTDAELFGKITGTVVPSCFWRNKEEFVKQGVGFSLMLGDDPVSTAFSAFVHKPQLEIGIETRSQFQEKGLAQLTCSAFIDYCLENNFEPVWSCRLDNTGSYKLAQKLGFEVVRMIPFYLLP